MPQLFFLEPNDLQRSLYPFSLTRKVLDMPVGLLSLHHKWAALQLSSSVKLRSRIFSIRSNLFPTESIWKKLIRLNEGESLLDAHSRWLATAGKIDRIPADRSTSKGIIDPDAKCIDYPWDFLPVLQKGIEMDFRLLTKGRRSQVIGKGTVVIGKNPVFIERGAKVYPGIFHTEVGPIYIGKDSVVQEGAMIRGPFLLGDRSVITPGAKIAGATAVGENCVVGGEIKRSLMFSCSNKAHEGYMGDSVIGSWCNWGAGTSNSNIKNTAGMIRVAVGDKMVEVGQKCGVFMGDHSRTVINSSLSCGSIIGVSVQVGNEGLSAKRISSFRWMDGKRYRYAQALEHIQNWKALKGQPLLPEEKEQLLHIYKTDK